MAHSLAYYKDITQSDGSVVRLEIHRKATLNTMPEPMEIGPVVQELRLDIQGGADMIDAPIVKTLLTMTFVDAPDLEPNKKCGNWDEFYSPDSTMWMVVLKVNGKTIWSGYVTPDSYAEELRYRGSVTIIARDNIGHMQDFPFDMEGNTDGMITLQELVNEAWAKIESPMFLDWRHEEDDADYLLCDGVEAPQTYMNASAFEDMNFYDAIDKALYSYGLVMRYTGSNRVTIMSLRDLPYQGKSSTPRVAQPTFISYAQRELAPAARRIEETVQYKFGEGVQVPLAKGVSFTDSSYTVPFLSTNIFGETSVKDIPVHAIANTTGEGWSNIPSSTLFFNPKAYTITDSALKEDAERMLFFACDTDGSHSATYRKTIICKDFHISMKFGRPVQRIANAIQYCYGFSAGSENNGIGSMGVKKVSCYISSEQEGATSFYNGNGWQADAFKIDIEASNGEFGIDVGFKGITGQTLFAISIENIELDTARDYSDGDGLYVPISSMFLGATNSQSLCDVSRVISKYIDSNNVIIERSPEFAPALDEVPFPATIKNGIFVKSGNAYLPARKWAWSGGTPQQMAVYNHLQLLCYHAKPNNVISGDIIDADFEDMAVIYEWGAANHILVSGSYNFLNGRIESAVLREFIFYSQIWGDASGLPDTEEKNQTTAESGGGPSGAGSSSGSGSTSGGGGGEGGGSITVDSAMSDTSTNPVQNKVIKAYVDDAKQDAINVSAAFTVESINGMKEYWFDDEMSDDSRRGVRNYVIKAYVDDKHNELAFLKDMFYWADEAHTVIGTKYPFFSERTLTAGGRKTEEDSGGSGGGITITDVADYLEQQGYATEQWVADKDYATNSALKSLSDKVDSIENNGVDLTGYATEQWVKDQKYATEEALKSLSDKVDGLPGTDVDLTGYATEQWVKDQGYVTNTSLEATFSGIDTRLKALEKLLDWFEFDETAQMIKAKFGIYSVGAITAAKKEEEE